MAYSITIIRVKATPNPINQLSGVLRVSTMALILSVIVANVYPGPMIDDRDPDPGAL
jgi:hypothetical protein